MSLACLPQVGDSNPFYHWGALSGYIAMREARADPGFAREWALLL